MPCRRHRLSQGLRCAGARPVSPGVWERGGTFGASSPRRQDLLCSHPPRLSCHHPTLPFLPHRPGRDVLLEAGSWASISLCLLGHVDVWPFARLAGGGVTATLLALFGEEGVRKAKGAKGRKMVSLWRRKTKQNKSLTLLYYSAIRFNSSLNKITKSERFWMLLLKASLHLFCQGWAPTICSC